MSSSGTPAVWGQRRDTIETWGPLEHDTTADVVVVGAGITGVSIAHELARRGISVVVVDRSSNAIAPTGETAHSTAHLTSAIDDRYAEMEAELGFARARLLGQSQVAAIRRIESICAEEAIDCGFERLEGFLTVPHPYAADAAMLLGQEQLASSRAGVHAMLLVQAPGMSTAAGPCLCYPNQAQIDPLRYLGGLRARAAAMGVRFFNSTHVAEVTGGEHPFIVTDRGRTVSASSIVVATNAPIVSTVSIPLRQTAYRTYVAAFRAPAEFPQHLWWDGAWNGDAYHYVRVARRDERSATVVVGGEDHVTGREPPDTARFERLEGWAREFFPLLADAERAPVIDRWSGQVFEPHDGLPLIGRAPHERHVFLATGDSGQGFTSSAIAAVLVPELLEGRKHAWESLFAPTRAPRDWRTAIVENVGTALSYGEWLSPKPTAPGNLRPGHGVVVRVRGGLRAISMSADGRIHERSAVCPHLKGLVRWNAHEQSWDCPCHGSRFADSGELLTGPANAGLAQ